MGTGVPFSSKRHLGRDDDFVVRRLLIELLAVVARLLLRLVAAEAVVGAKSCKLDTADAGVRIVTGLSAGSTAVVLVSVSRTRAGSIITRYFTALPSSSPVSAISQPGSVGLENTRDRPVLLAMTALSATFAAEADETLAALEQGLLELERSGGDADTLNSVFRAAHNLKGSAKVAGFPEVGELAHVAEELLVRLRDGKLRPSKGNVTILLAAVDELRVTLADALAGAEQGAATIGPTAHHAATAATVRVESVRLDQLVDLMGELLMARSRVEAMLRERDLPRASILEAHASSARLYDDLREVVMALRMVPIAPVFHAQARTVRDAAAAIGKQVRLEILDVGVQLDANLADGIRDPLTHMLRNAIDHGLESPEDRIAAGKDPCGTICIATRRDGGSIIITVADDGRGFDRERIRAKAVGRGDIADDAALDDAALLDLVFLPGFSTAAKVTEISGRGVGMDVVRRNVEALRGSVSLTSVRGAGSTVTIRLPLSLAIIGGFQVGVGEQLLVLPAELVVECLEYEAPGREDEALATSIVASHGRALPVVRLRHVFGTTGAKPDRQSVVVVRHREQVLGLVVDRLHGTTPTVVKPLGRLLSRGGPVAASALSGANQVALILDLEGVLRAAKAMSPNADSSSPVTA